MDEHLKGEVASVYLSCIHCGLCLPACPTYRETGNEAESPRGRIHLVRSLVEGRVEPGAATIEHLDSCVGCRACESACPADVQYGSLLERARHLYVEPARPAGWRKHLLRPLIREVLPHRNRLALAVRAGRVARALLERSKPSAWLPERLSQPLALLPRTEPTAPLPEWTPAVGAERGTVAFLAGCAMPVFFGGANEATVRLLACWGYRVWVPPQAGCCGAIHQHDGDLLGAKARAKAQIEAFERQGCTAIVVNAAGCGATMKHYAELLASEPAWAERASRLAAKTQDLSELLASSQPPLAARPLEAVVTYHDPCHLAHGQGVRQAPRELIRSIPGVRYQELEEADWCCGGAGTYALLQPEMSQRLLGHKLRHIEASGAEIVVTANPPCLLQIGAGLAQLSRPPRLVHLAELLWEVYGGAAEERA